MMIAIKKQTIKAWKKLYSYAEFTIQFTNHNILPTKLFSLLQ